VVSYLKWIRLIKNGGYEFLVVGSGLGKSLGLGQVQV